MVLKELAGDVAHLAELLAFSVIESLGALDEMGPHREAIWRDKPRNSFRQHPGLLEPSVICRIGDPASVTLVILYKPRLAVTIERIRVKIKGQVSLHQNDKDMPVPDKRM